MDASFARRMRLPMFFLGIAGGALTLLLLQAKPGEPLTRAALDAARATWKRVAIAHYEFEIEVSGTQQGHHSVTVRGGKVIAMTTDGAATLPHVHKFWTVEGMFDFLEAELDRAGRRLPETSAEVILQAHFDGTRGYPLRFVRHVTGETGSIEWEMRRFAPAP